MLKNSSLQGFLEERGDSEDPDEDDLLHHMEMDDSDGDEDMMMDRDDRDSDDMEDDDDL